MGKEMIEWGTLPAKAAAEWCGKCRSLLAALVIGLVVAGGCGKAPPPPADLSKAPWLDPQVQIKNLKESDERVRRAAASNLGGMGANAAAALPELERLAASDPSTKVRDNAKEAIEKIKAATK